MKFSVDRMSEGLATVISQSGEGWTLPQSWLPEGCREGMLLDFCEETGEFRLLKEETEERRAQLSDKLNALLEKGKES